VKNKSGEIKPSWLILEPILNVFEKEFFSLALAT